MSSLEEKEMEVRVYREWYESLTAEDQERVLLDYFRSVPADARFVVARTALSMIDADGSIEKHGIM